MTYKLGVKKKLRILDFDIEARPLSFWGDRPSIEITAIASAFIGESKTMKAYLLGQDPPEYMLTTFVERYNAADMVVGHNIRSYDLPQINGALLEYGMEKLEPKLTQDTYLDMYKRGDIPASQEYLLDLFGIGTKYHMGQHAWRKSNRLTKDGLKSTYIRVTGDVSDNINLRKEMLKRNLLKSPKVWYP